MKIIIDSDIPYVRGVLEPYAEVSYLKGNLIAARDAADADALVVRTRTKCDAALLEGSRVKLIATATIGFDHIDMTYCEAAGIKVVTAAGSNARGVLQWVGAALDYLSRVQGWEPAQKTLGVVGVGHVGTLVAKYASEWGFRVVCCDPPRQRLGEKPPVCESFVNLDAVLEQADIITLHTPLTYHGEDATFHLAGDDFFGRLAKGAVIINSSRGEVVDTAGLLASLQRGDCSCAIDTWENEPNIERQLLGMALAATPHIAGYSAQGKANASSIVVQAVAAQFGLPLTNWYPSEEVPEVVPRPISWEELSRTIGGYFDIAAETKLLKDSPGGFEEMRNNYRYRTEYF